jgi:hypothetical protein
VSSTETPVLVVSSELAYHNYGTGEKIPIHIPVFRPSGNPIESYRIMAGFYSTGDSVRLTLSDEQLRQFLQIQAVGRVSPSLLLIFNPRHFLGQHEEPKQILLRRILSLRDSIEAKKGILPESYPLIREDRER